MGATYQAPYTQGIINQTPQGARICPWFPGNPSHNATFKKRFNYIKVIMFGTVIFTMGIYIPDVVVINTSYIIKKQ